MDLNAIEKETITLLAELKTAGQCARIELSDVQKQIEMLKRETILKEHKYSVFQGADGSWRTHVPDRSAKEGRKLIKRKNREDLETAIVKAYRENDKVLNPTLSKVYPLWLEHYKARAGSDNTVKRAVASWNRYYANDPIIKRPIESMAPTEIETWLHTRIKEEGMDKKKYYNMSLPFRQIMDFAFRSHITATNTFGDVKINAKTLTKKRKPDSSTQVYTDAEETFLMKCAWQEWEEDNSLGACLALVLLFHTGLRIGEVVALKANDIHGMYADISRTEVETSVQVDESTFVQTGHAVVDHAKTSAGIRTIYLTKGGKEVIEAATAHARITGADNTPDGDYYLFRNGNARCNVDAVTYRLKKFCKVLGIPFRSAHKIRKTYVSHLIDGGVNIDAVREQVGHEDERTTLNCYCFNTLTQDETNALFEAALSSSARGLARIG